YVPALDGHRDDAIIARIPIERGYQLLPVSAGLGHKPQRSRYRAVFIGLQTRSVLQPLPEIVIRVRCLDSQGISQRVGDPSVLFVVRTPKPDAKNFECGGIPAFQQDS